MIQQVVGGVLYYARAVDNTVLVTLSDIASEQTTEIEATYGRVLQLLDYLASKPSAVVQLHVSDMILNIQSEASCLSETSARSRVVGRFILGSKPVNGKSININGTVHVFCCIMKFVVASAAETELGAQFLDTKEWKIL